MLCYTFASRSVFSGLMTTVAVCFCFCITKAIFFFFFSSRRRHTRSTRDWSSDVSLPISAGVEPHVGKDMGVVRHLQTDRAQDFLRPLRLPPGVVMTDVAVDVGGELRATECMAVQIGRASCRERGWGEGVSAPVEETDGW